MIHKISSRAKELGFIGVGYSLPSKPLFFNEYKRWISSGRNAEMSWMERHIDIREGPKKLLPGCKAVISVAYPYPGEKPATKDGFTLARYSRPAEDDYHIQLREKCLIITDLIKEICRDSMFRICVDSAPILERSFAYSSGIGFIGKNNMLIIPGYGSYFPRLPSLRTS